MAVIEVEQLVKHFGKIEAVGGISFAVQPGQLFGFLGPNGAGKTTTLKMLSTLLTPTSGRALVNGYDIVRERDKVRRSIGITFQDPSLDDQLTASENLLFHAMIYKIPSAERGPRMKSALELVELTDKSDTIVKTFSGGMKRRLELARCLMHRPVVLFLDEPTVGLDPQTRRRIWESLNQLRQEHGLTLFLTTHYMEEAEVCDQIAIIDHGRIIVQDTPDALKGQVGQDRIELRSPSPRALADELEKLFHVAPEIQDQNVSIMAVRGDEFVVKVIPQLKTPLSSLHVRRPTLEDVFVKLTGHAIRDEEADKKAMLRTAFRKRR